MVNSQAPIRGRDCSPPHALDQRVICTGPLCLEWLRKVAVPLECTSDHAHESHYYSHWRDNDVIHACPGRRYCDPKYMAPEPGPGYGGPPPFLDYFEEA